MRGAVGGPPWVGDIGGREPASLTRVAGTAEEPAAEAVSILCFSVCFKAFLHDLFHIQSLWVKTMPRFMCHGTPGLGARRLLFRVPL